MKVLGKQAYDWESIRMLAERGVAYIDIAKHFNGLDPGLIAKKAHSQDWLTPSREVKMRKELQRKQKEAMARSGSARDPNDVMKEVWLDRQQRMDEKAWNIVEAALDGVSEEKAKDMILEAKDLKTIVDVGRKVSGKDLADAQEMDKGPTMAIAVGFLRSAGPDCVTPTVDV